MIAADFHPTGMHAVWEIIRTAGSPQRIGAVASPTVRPGGRGRDPRSVPLTGSPPTYDPVADRQSGPGFEEVQANFCQIFDESTTQGIILEWEVSRATTSRGGRTMR
jgi:hypothetical protein